MASFPAREELISARELDTGIRPPDCIRTLRRRDARIRIKDPDGAASCKQDK